MEVVFNESMNTEFNHSTLNKTSVDIYIKPYYEDEDQLKERLESNLNLTWYIKSYNKSSMLIKLDFEVPTDISIYEIKD